MGYRRLAPCAALADAVEYLWILEQPEGEREAQPVLPDGRMELVFQLARPFEQRHTDGRWLRQGGRLLVGQQLRRVDLRPCGATHCLGVHLAPAGLACFVAGDLRRFSGRILDLAEAFPAAPTLEALRDAPDAVRAVQDWLLSQRRASPDPVVQAALRALDDSTELETIAATLGLSERQLRRRFESAVGLAPKRYARLQRFQQVFAQAREGEAQAWAEAALDGGYCDQSHFNRDFRAFTGQSPRELLRELAPLTEFFLSDLSKTARAPRT